MGGWRKDHPRFSGKGEQHRVALGQCSLDSSSAVRSVYVGALYYYFNSLFYGVACLKLHQRVRQQINIIEKCDLQAAMTFSTDLYIPVCWFRCGNCRHTLKTPQQKRGELHIFCLIHGISGPFGHLKQRKEDGVLRR